MKYTILVRQIHRKLVLVISALGVIMLITGFAMKYPLTFLAMGIDPLAARKLHNLTSTFFSIVFALMGITGLYMYIAPLLRKKPIQAKPESVQQTDNRQASSNR